MKELQLKLKNIWSEDQVIQEGRMSDMHIDAQEMSREEFVATYPGYGKDWDRIHSEDMDEDGSKYTSKEFKDYWNEYQSIKSGDAITETSN